MVREFLAKISKRQLIVTGIALGALLVVGAIACLIVYNKREALLASTIARLQTSMANDHQVDFIIGQAYFSGLSTVTLSDITVSQQERDKLANISKVSISVRLLPLITGTIRFGRLHVHDAHITLQKRDSISNYDFIFSESNTMETDTLDEATSSPTTVNLAQAANRLLNNILYKIPENMEVRNFTVTYSDDSTRQQISIPKADINRGKLTSAVFLNNNKAAWQVSGKLNPGKRQLYVKVHANGQKIELPLLEQKFGLKLSFDTIETRLREVYWRNNEFLHIEGEWAVKNLKINHWRIAQEDVTVPDAHIDAKLVVGENHLELSNTSAVTMKRLIVHPYLRYTASPHKTYALALETPEMEAQDLFDAFPKGLFESLEGIRVSGNIKYKMDAFLDTNQPDSVQFSSNMEQKDFKVNAWGKVNIPKINSTFVYTPYEYEKPVRDIIVGPENPNFIPLSRISSSLRNAILTTEDPSFFSHHGFVEEAIRASIATNYRERAFKRGGSTISMQLVKNVYLNRNKTIVRKLEEILIVWLIESTRAVSKERMFEVYLNVIEWGRNVYGITEAAHYYFNKQPAELSLGESIYLASIVPRPKTGLYSFNYDGGLKPYISPYFSYIGNIMARRGLTPADSTGSYGFYNVSLKESLRPEKPASVDTLQLELPASDFEVELEQVRGLLDRIFKSDKKEEENP